jgi:initiation factor 1A
MPNLRGGKAYKKGKKIGNDKDEVVSKFLQREKDQEYARVIRMLGNRRVICFCNDGKERNCKIRGSLCKGPKKQKITVGDIVLLSFRDFDASSEEDEEDDEEDTANNKNVQHSGTADIIYKFHRDHWRHIKKEAGVHRLLFSTEDISGKTSATLDDLFDYNSEENSENDEENKVNDKKDEVDKPVQTKTEAEIKFTDIEDDDIDAI